MKKSTFIIATALIVFSGFVTNNLKAADDLVGTVVAITGKILNATNKAPASVKITAIDESGKKVNSTRSNESDGTYYITKLSPGHIYTFLINDENYLISKYSVTIPELKKYTELSKDFLVYPKASNIKIKLSVSPFEYSKSKIRYGYALLMEDYVNLLSDNPNINFTIVCYPDNNNNPAENTTLTAQRAQSILDYLVTRGIDPSRIQISANNACDPNNPMPIAKAAKGKKYIGTTYFEIK